MKLFHRIFLAAAAVSACLPASATAQRRIDLPPSRADFLVREGRWTEAELEYYQQNDREPRNPQARAALGRYLAMKGAVRPGSVLVEEAKRFGLDNATYRALITPMKAILEFRADAAGFRRDSTLSIRASRDPEVLFQVGLPRTDRNGRVERSGDVDELIWHDVVDRPIGLDSLNERGRPMGFEVFEALVPSIDMREEEMTLHAGNRTALPANGRRFPVLRWVDGVQVLLGEHTVLPLGVALRQLRARWWQLDLVRGVLVVR